LEQGVSHVQKPTPNATQTGHEVRSSAKEDAETKGPGKVEVQEEVIPTNLSRLLARLKR
jgi:hypothetical protein